MSYTKGLAEALSHVTRGVSGDSFLFLPFLLAFQRPSELNQRQFRCMAVLYEALAHGGPSIAAVGSGYYPPGVIDDEAKTQLCHLPEITQVVSCRADLFIRYPECRAWCIQAC